MRVILMLYCLATYIRKSSGEKLVFDIFDRYAMVFIPPRYKTLYSFVNSIEEIMSL